jgi:2-polyprenyl-3-methyl-5-hydroxy-6-metoxy-1,4-benzoquinol methylase
VSRLPVFGENSIDIIDLGMHAFADTFIPPEKLNSSEPTFPLICSLDKTTGYIHNKINTEAFERYNLYDYSYTSSNSSFARNHWIEYSHFINKLLGDTNCQIIEIGANDGFLCNELEKYKYKTIAIDSSKAMTEISLNTGLDAINMMFNSENIEKSKLEYNFYDCIIANNVFNHANDPLDFLIATRKLLKPDGFYVFEVPYWLNLIESKHFDQIYHEHVSYFTVFSLKNLMSQAGFKILNFDVVDYHGGSLRVVAVKDNNPISGQISKIEKQIDTEREMKLFEPETYVKFQEEIETNRSNFLSKIHEIKLSKNNVPIIGIGAAAKANTLLTYYGLNNTYIDFITDMSPFKIGKFTPLTRIPIYPDSKISELQDVFAIILSWNISDSLVSSISQINRNARFIKL